MAEHSKRGPARATLGGVKMRLAALDWSLLQRILLASMGGYVLCALATALLATSLPMTRVNAVLSATMLSFLVFTGVVMWAFYTPHLRRLWIRLGGACGVLGALLWLHASFGGGA